MARRVLTFALEAGPLSWLPPPVSAFAGAAGVDAALEALVEGEVALMILDHSSAPDDVERLLTRARERLGENTPSSICFIDPQTDSSVARHLVAEHEVRRLLFHPLERGQLIEEVEKFLGRRTPPPSSQPEVGGAARTVAPGPAAESDRAASESTHPRLLIVDADDDFVEKLVDDTRTAGYDAVGVTDLDAAREQMVKRRPDLVLLDITLEEEGATGYSLLRAFSVLNPPVPVIALTRSSVFMDRVQAARYGARVFLHKSTSPDRILAEVGSLLQRLQPVRPRILVVDGDHEVRRSLREILAPEGLEVVSLGDPLDFWSVLESTSPDLLVVDVDLPTVSGIELCRIVRNDPRWSSMPVLFLTARADPETVQRIFTAGADDFVTKPLVGPVLLTRIRNRLERSQLLRSLSESDPLTGIANRRRALEMAERLLALARRHGQPLCIAVLDLDDFKGVNDRYGHRTGDRVLRRLADVLQRKFRGEDVVGRWGGEEFMLGMYGMTAPDGERRLYDVLASFRSHEFIESGLPPLHVTFSAGIAEFPTDGDEFETLYRAADAALYRAKEAGRSRILRATTGPLER